MSIPSLVALSAKRTRSSRDDQALVSVPPALGPAERDAEGRIVYVDLQGGSELLGALLARLSQLRPTPRVLERRTPINRGRILVEIEDPTAFHRFHEWFLWAAANVAAFRELIEPLGERIRLLGGQFIVPKVTEYEPRILAQTPHTDVDTKGEVIAVAIHLEGEAMGTWIDPEARISASGAVLGDRGFGRADTPIFAYDTGAVHAGPGVAHVPPPYPRYFTSRAFVLLCSDALHPMRLAEHRLANGLRGSVDLTIRPSDPPRPDPRRAS